jgi:hypothetical protein
MTKHSVTQAARRSALGARAVRRWVGAVRERRLEGLAVEVGLRRVSSDAAICDAERRAGRARRIPREPPVRLHLVRIIRPAYCHDALGNRDTTVMPVLLKRLRAAI